MRKVLFDTNVILDIILEREPHFEYSIKAVNVINKKVIGYIDVLTLVNTFYFARKKVKIEKVKEFIQNLLDLFKVINASKETCIKALNSDFNDFEDAIQEFSAVDEGIEIIVTRNIKDFKHSVLKVLSPEEFFNTLN